MTTYDPRYLDNLPGVAQNDVAVLREKEATYRGSWRARGGVGAFMMLARKWDRLENIVRVDHYDVFAAVARCPGGHDGTPLAEIRDLRRYLMLVEAHLLSADDVSDDIDILEAASISGELGGKKVLLEIRPRAERSTPGTPDDGGHHARRPVLLRTDPRVRVEDGMLDKSEHWPTIMVGRYFNVDRDAVHPDDREHLPDLRLELNYMEHRDMKSEYKSMYVWDEQDSKFRLRSEFVMSWGVQP